MKSKIITTILLISFVFLANAQLELVIQTGNKGAVVKTEFSKDENFVLSLDEFGNLVIWNLAQRKQYSSFNDDDLITDATFCNDSILAIAKSNELILWNFKNNNVLKSVKNFPNSERIEKLISSRKSIYVLKGKDLFFIEFLKQDTKVTKIEELGSIENVYLSNRGNMICVQAGKKLNLFDLSSMNLKTTLNYSPSDVFVNEENSTIGMVFNNSVIRTIQIERDSEKYKILSTLVNNRATKKYKSIAISKNTVVVGNQNDNLTIFKQGNGKVLNQIKNNSFSIHSIAISNNENLLSVGGENGIIQLYDFSDFSKLQTFESLSPNATSIKFLPDSTSILIGYDNGVLKKWDLKNHIVKTVEITKTFVDRLKQVNYSIYNLNDNPIALKSYKGGLFAKKEKVKNYYVHFNDQFNQLKLSKNKDFKYDKSNFKKNETIPMQEEMLDLPVGTHIISAQLSIDSTYVLAGASNGILYLFDYFTGEKKLKLISPNPETFFYASPDNYYFSSKSALKSIGVRYQDKLLGFEQLDLIYNRPDKILSKLNYTDSTQISFLEDVYKKRIQKLELNENNLKEFDQLPVVKTNLNKIPNKTNETIYNIEIYAFSKFHELKNLHILLNGIPIYGRNGIAINDLSFKKNIDIKLSPGENHIQIFVEDRAGLKSFREDTYVTLKKEFNPSLYVLSIGSGTFKNKNYNLTYAKKDALDIINTFENNKHYSSKFFKSILNQDVTNKNIKDGLSWLEQANDDDVILVFFAGHGILDENFNYYLSSSEIDFNNPKENGILYDEFEYKLGMLRCRNKVLFIDACHSGELDKEEVKIEATSQVVEEDVEFRSIGTGVTKLGKSTFEISKNIFADLRPNSGVLVISSAGGAEYAMEGKKWSNGVFTYALIKGLTEKKADLDRNNKVSLFELQKYLFNEVYSLTNGKQTPTSRVEILEHDFRIW